MRGIESSEISNWYHQQAGLNVLWARLFYLSPDKFFTLGNPARGPGRGSSSSRQRAGCMGLSWRQAAFAADSATLAFDRVKEYVWFAELVSIDEARHPDGQGTA